MQSNALVPINWLQQLLPIIKQSSHCKIVVFSARIGSITDNKLGGWYSYRASKAALNMLLKTAAPEFKRRAPCSQIIAFHPGTTDSSLSRPFQHNVPNGKLFSAYWVANRLFNILNDLDLDTGLKFIDYDMQPIDW